MATRTNDAEELNEDTKAARSSMVPLLLAVVAAVLVSAGVVGAAGFWLLRSGRLGVAAPAAKTQAEAPKAVEKNVSLEPFVVNLADGDGQAYLRVAVTLRVEEAALPHDAKAKEEKPAKGEAANAFEAEERDALLSVLGRQTSAALLGPEGKEQLRHAMLDALAQRVAKVKVDQILFTEFLVQR